MQKCCCQAIIHPDSFNTVTHNQHRSVTWQQFLGDIWPVPSINFQIGMNVQIHILENPNSYLFVSMGEYQGFVGFFAFGLCFIDFVFGFFPF